MKLFLILILIIILPVISYAKTNFSIDEYIICDSNYKITNDNYTKFICNFDLKKEKKKPKKFGEDMYNEVKEFEDSINNAFKDIVLPDFIPDFMKENMDFKVNYRKKVVFSLTYCHKY